MVKESVPRLLGRSGSLCTRVVRIWAYEHDLHLPMDVVQDLRACTIHAYGGHPGLKIPVLVCGTERLYGARTICRRLGSDPGWAAFPAWRAWEYENALEVASEALQAQIRLTFGIQICKLPAENPFFTKAAAGLSASLNWLATSWPTAERANERPSLLEVEVYCLWRHLEFRSNIARPVLEPLETFARHFDKRESAIQTPYRLDAK